MTGSAGLIRIVKDKRLFITALLVVVMPFAWANTPLLAQQTQETPEDLTDLTLEELMELDVLFVNVLGTHTHLAGEWMIGYKFKLMRMEGESRRHEQANRGRGPPGFPSHSYRNEYGHAHVRGDVLPVERSYVDGYVPVP